MEETERMRVKKDGLTCAWPRYQIGCGMQIGRAHV